jgi:hypothetical protein
MPAQQANKSQSIAENLICAGSNVLEKNARGYQAEDGEGCCCKVAPTQSEEASTINASSKPC